MIYLDLLMACDRLHAAITLRRRHPVPFNCEAEAVAAGIAMLRGSASVIGFILVPDGLQAANDAAFMEKTITSAMAARRARQARKAAEVQP